MFRQFCRFRSFPGFLENRTENQTVLLTLSADRFSFSFPVKSIQAFSTYFFQEADTLFTEVINMEVKKTALALGGGGSRGSYEGGVCQALSELNKSFDLVTGTSIGAVCGAVYVQGKIDSLLQLMAGFTQSSVSDNLFMFKNQYDVQNAVNQPVNAYLGQILADGPSIDPLRQNLGKIFDFNAFQKSPVDCACISYNMSQSQDAVFEKKNMTAENSMDQILASTAYFPAFNMQLLSGDYYLDGSFASIQPWNLAARMGADQITAVVLKNYSELPDDLQQEGCTFIYPILNLAYYLDFEGALLERQGKQGYLEAMKYLEQAPGYLYTFYPEDWTHMVHLEKLVLELVVQAGKADLLEEYETVMNEIYEFLLGYKPRPFKNKYQEQFLFGRLLECLGLIAGVDLYTQIHFKDFIREILTKFESLTSNPNLAAESEMVSAMQHKGLKDLMVFFHTALLSYGNTLPPAFDVLKKKYLLPYYLGWGWHAMEKFKLVFLL